MCIQCYADMAQISLWAWQLIASPVGRHHMLTVAVLERMRQEHLHVHAIWPKFSRIRVLFHAFIDQPWVEKWAVCREPDNHVCLGSDSCLLVALENVILRSAPTWNVVLDRVRGERSVPGWDRQPDVLN